ncbi:hypothetical protein M0802_007565 [Mischocyttarus mexicanus]|nr:hypothetical protein M0802_007565 [Mischocyttarus mexicanus]
MVVVVEVGGASTNSNTYTNTRTPKTPTYDRHFFRKHFGTRGLLDGTSSNSSSSSSRRRKRIRRVSLAKLNFSAPRDSLVGGWGWLGGNYIATLLDDTVTYVSVGYGSVGDGSGGGDGGGGDRAKPDRRSGLCGWYQFESRNASVGSHAQPPFIAALTQTRREVCGTNIETPTLFSTSPPTPAIQERPQCTTAHPPSSTIPPLVTVRHHTEPPPPSPTYHYPFLPRTYKRWDGSRFEILVCRFVQLSVNPLARALSHKHQNFRGKNEMKFMIDTNLI